MFEKTVLPNGLPVLTVQMPHVQSVAVSFFLGAGSRYEPDEEGGISHFLEHLSFKGTPSRPGPQQIAEAIERVGGYMNAATDREMTVYWAKVARPYFDTAVDVLSDMVVNSLYKADEMERERQVILEELAAVNDSPAQKVDALIDETIWPGQPLGRDVAGTKSSVGGINRDMVVAYSGDQYGPNNTVLGVAGALTHEEVVEAVQKATHDWEARPPRTWIPSANGHSAPVVGVEYRKTEQAHFCLGLRGVSSHHPDRYALALMNVVLGEGMSSRLFMELRERRGLAYDVHSSISHLRDDGSVVVYAGVEPSSINDAVKRTMTELDGIKQVIPEDELDKAKAMTKGRLLLRTEDTRSMAGWVGAQELLLGEVRKIDDVIEEIDTLTAADVQRVAEEVIQMDRLHLAVVGPFRSASRFEKLLAG